MADFTFVRNVEGRSTFVFRADPNDDGEYLGEIWKQNGGWVFVPAGNVYPTRIAAAKALDGVK